MQRYVAAVLAGDQQGASSYLAPSAAVGREPGIGADPANSSVEVQSATERGGSAEVRVLISTRDGSGPFSGGYERSDAFSLIRSSQAGKIESGPWEFFPCPRTYPSCCLSLPPIS